MGNWIVHFHEGDRTMKTLLGGKGANLAEMTKLGLPIPPGFTVTTEACRSFYEGGMRMPDGLFDEIVAALAHLEERKGMKFGHAERPLLVSVRSGSVTSMPGMMDTILNLGLNDESVQGLARQTGNAAFASDSYRRFIQMYGNVVLGIPTNDFEKIVKKEKEMRGAEKDQDVTHEAWTAVIEQYKRLVLERTGAAFPQDVREQLEQAVKAVFASWNNARAKVYRKAYGIPDDQGTAVNVQAMVFGNLGEGSGTGVLFSRNPSTGEQALYGEYLLNAQGEDVVAGVRTPKRIEELAGDLPDVHERLRDVANRLERHYKDMQDIEFTVEQGELYVLQTRNGKRTAQAAVKIAVDLMNEGLLSGEEAVQRIEPMHLDRLLHPSIRESSDMVVAATGLPASPGAATGVVVLDADRSVQWRADGRRVILVTQETTPEDIHGVIASEGVLTSRGGMTSHAAVVARGMGKPCVCGCESVTVDLEARAIRIGAVVVREGEWISIDGATGRVILGKADIREPEMTEELAELLRTADGIRTMKIYANADNPHDAAIARHFGAEGIGLCRTEHMFMSGSRLAVFRDMILAECSTERQAHLDTILPMQQSDFEGIFEAMDGLPVTVRLLDPPLHEFLPDLEQLLGERRQLSANGAAESALATMDRLIVKVRAMCESNPMLGLRGCRLGLMFPEIYDMQLSAIFLAAKACLQRGIRVKPEIMIPLVGHPNELKGMAERIDSIAERTLGEDRALCRYKKGTMIEVPRAALVAGDIAVHAEFFSFGTNDLTQMTFGYSRDDAEGKFLNKYIDQGILPENPFETLDESGVGQLIEMAVLKGKSTRPTLKAGVCGEHGGERRSILYCHRVGLDYVSCSPFRVPYARIAAAQAALLTGGEKRVEPVHA
ncbi:pyruvate, phosphate dikinase [Paenibacillus sp.]|uniref:pyruvate, phosphate dikinase n=1 Tax=Paenibacillus sp. TaxID=58172 RepID=UPI002810BE36|nr:pyruvate, phosphate dikinase [Paenibacillus sp.]